VAKIRYRDTKLSAAKLTRIATINTILAEYDGQKLSARQVYYRLVGLNEIENTVRSYKNLTNLLTDARYAGLVDWDAIEDRGREPTIWSEHASIDAAVRRAVDGFRLPRWKTQPKYVELWVEKQALAGVLEPIAAESHVTLLVNKGYSSASAMKEAADRLTFRQGYGADEVEGLDGEPREVIILYLGDHDPSGVDMVRDIGVRLEEFGVRRLEIRRVALTRDQVDQFHLPPQPLKRGSAPGDSKHRDDDELRDSRGAGYEAEHGDQSWELDAIPPREFTRIVRRALKSVTDADAMAAVIEEEDRQTAIINRALRKALK
jgi:hypothetical protein